jgi:glycogen debranching enzyme
MEYKNAEDDLRAKVLVHFYVNDNLVDFIYPETTGNGLTNASYLIRPNVFIAYYVYSELLPAEQWEIIFDKALEGLWLDWGGLSSLDKRNSAFVNEHTGENNASYHRGDSWYYLNCMAATCLLKVNREKYLATADKIISACTEECLHNGVIGSLAEVSSAKELSGYGCFSQAWSLAMFIELIEERY